MINIGMEYSNYNILNKIFDRLQTDSLNKLALVNKKYKQEVTNYYSDVFKRKIIQKIDFFDYMNSYNICVICHQFSDKINYNCPLKTCQNCIDENKIKECDDCTHVDKAENFVEKDACAAGDCISYVCLDGCKFRCTNCNRIYDDKRDIKQISENKGTYLCNICYTQRNTYKIGIWYGENPNDHYRKYGHYND